MTKQELEMCLDKYGRDIYSFCKHLTNDPTEADDLYQDTFLTAVELKGKIDCGNNPKSYLLSIALRIWKNKKRKYAWRKRIADVRSLADERDADTGESAELSTAQIAETLKIPMGTVLSRLHQARKILKKELEDVLNG